MIVSSTRPLVGSPVALPEDVIDLASGNVDASLLPRLDPALARLELSQPGQENGSEETRLLSLIKRRLAAEGQNGSHVFLGSGALDAIERAIRTQVRPGSAVAVEDPGFPPVLDLLRSLGMRLMPVPIDGDGPSIAALAGHLHSGVAAVVMTPRAQSPSGVSISYPRAAALSHLLVARPAPLVILDDHWHFLADTTFPFDPAAFGRWVVVRSVSKSLGPDFRLAFAFGDETTIGRMRHQQALGPGWISGILQRIVAELWECPATAGLIDRARIVYRDRRQALIRELEQRGVEASGTAGLHVWVPVPSEADIVQCMLKLGWAIQAGEPFRIDSPPAVRIATANLQVDRAGEVARDLARCLADLSGC